MFINAIFIHFFVLLAIINTQIVQDDIQTEQLIQSNSQQSPQKENCPCLNNGQCYSLSYNTSPFLNSTKEVYCRCSNYFIGKQCEIEAYPIYTTKELTQKINIRNYKYFYFEPMEENMYSFSFQLCLDTKMPKASQKTPNDTITFFLTTEGQNGNIFTDQDITKPVTVTFDPDECKIITVDYTVLSITKVKTIQKLVLALKLGQKITAETIKNEQERDKIIDKESLNEVQEPLKDKQNIVNVQNQPKTNDQDNDKLTFSNSIQKSETSIHAKTQILPIKSQRIVLDYHLISFTIQSTKKKTTTFKEDQILKKDTIKSINDFTSKSPSILNQKDDPFSSRTVSIEFSVYPFMVQFIVFNILFSLTTLAAFIIVGIMIFVIRSRILGIRISSNFGVSSRLVNDLGHFDRYIPAETFLRKERRQGDVSPNSSEIECAICLVKFENMDLIRRTPCSHSFHKLCIDRWCHGMLTCPMCRKSLTEKNLQLYFNSTALELKNSPESDE